MKIAAGILVLPLGFALFTVLARSHPQTATATTTQTALPPANPAHAAKCRKMLNSAPVTWKISGPRDGYGTVIVGPGFYAATFENKQWFDATVRCVLSDGREHSAGLKYVEYLDAYTNKEIAKWSDATGFSVD